MRPSTFRLLIAILVLTIFAAWVAWPANREIRVNVLGIDIRRDITIREGLDLQGGIQVLLAPDVPPGTEITDDAITAAKQVIESRVNALGVSEPQIQIGEQNRIIVEIPGIKNPDEAIKTFGQTGLLEFIDAGPTPLAPGTLVSTSEGPASTATSPATGAITPTQPLTTTGPVYQTVLTGRHLRSADVGFDQFNRPMIQFSFNDEGATIFADYTTENQGQYLAITLDKRVISSPVIRSPITGGSGVIEGNFNLEEARNLVIQLKYGALPVPLKVVQNRTVGPTLGQESLQKSIVAGIVGLSLVALFMIVHYRVPGVIAVVALTIYAILVFALFKLIPVTLTLAGIAGFILSVGMAVDANILIFERMKEELRGGRTPGAALDAGFRRAFSAIKDSNISTLITCAILYWFGATFGASIIQGFALTLSIGVLVSMFTAVIVTRTFLRALLNVISSEHLAGPIGLDVRSARTVEAA